MFKVRLLYFKVNSIKSNVVKGVAAYGVCFLVFL